MLWKVKIFKLLKIEEEIIYEADICGLWMLLLSLNLGLHARRKFSGQPS
jgi:aromatic ring-opening dioxygenase LigB subunit